MSRATYEICLNGINYKVEVWSDGDGVGGAGTRYGLRIDGGVTHLVDARRPVPDVLALLVDDHSWEAGLVPTDEGFDVEVVGVRHEVAVLDPKRKALRLSASDAIGVIKTAMPGRVVRVLVAAGDAVVKGQPVLVVEAMKMENELKSPRDGVIKRVAVEEGALVEAKATLVELT